MSTDNSHPTGEDDLCKDVSMEVAQGQSNKRPKRSVVWNHFSNDQAKRIATCFHCKSTFVSTGGTSNLLKHVKITCPVLKALRDASKNPSEMSPKAVDLDQDLRDASKNNSELVLKVVDFDQDLRDASKYPSEMTPKVVDFDQERSHMDFGRMVMKHNYVDFDQERSRMDFARMVIKHNYPFNMAEHEFFETFCNNLQPNFKLVSRNTLKGDVLHVYQIERAKLFKFLDELSCKITLTIDMWTSERQNFAYACLTAHYITDDWELKKKILAYKYIEYPHDGDTLFKFICDLILNWNLDSKLFSIVVDDASANDVMVRQLRKWLCEKSLLPLGGKLFHVRCSAHILNMIVQDGLKLIGSLISKIRESVRRFTKSPHAKQKFDTAVLHSRLGKKKVIMDIPTRWNSTYEMLDASLGLRIAFDRLEVIDKTYKLNPSDEEWQVARVICECLKIFHYATRHFSGTHFPTSNVFFPEICELQLKLGEWEQSEHEFLRLLASPMKVKFEKYWEECSLALAVAVILDPRYKLDVVEYYYSLIYGDSKDVSAERVRNAFVDLFNEYNNDYSDCTSSSRLVSEGGSSCDSHLPTGSSSYLGFHRWYNQSQAARVRAKKSEVEQYLGEVVFPDNENFNILNWWKVNCVKFPTLARMARDILAVPVTTVASEAAFSVGGRVIDETRASLLPEVVDALISANDWIECRKKRGHVEESSSEV